MRLNVKILAPSRRVLDQHGDVFEITALSLRGCGF
jgi:hypothetical protein